MIVKSWLPLAVYALLGALALMVGYLLSAPDEWTSFAALLLVGGVMTFPIWLRWHHGVLIATWNAALIVWFLPGQPAFWMVAVMVSLGFTMGQHLLVSEHRFPYMSGVTKTLLLLGLVVLATALIRGGVGIRALGNQQYGGKGYFYIFFAIAGYFALSAQSIPPERANAAVGWFFLSSVTALFSHLIYSMGSSYYFLYAFFDPEFAHTQAVAEFTGTAIPRMLGVSIAGFAVCYFMMARHGLEGILNLRRGYRLLICVAAAVISSYSGFRSVLIILGLLCVVQFYFEGLFSTRLFPMCCLLLVFTGALLVPLAPKLPYTMQRTLTVLPLKLDPAVRYDAQASSAWRVEIWELLWPDLPKYLLLGKGYSLDPAEMYLKEESIRRGLASTSEQAWLGGDYHNGALSIYVPFGTPGVLAFVLFLGAAVRILHRYHRHSPPALQRINTFLLSLFVTKMVYFWVVFGAISTDLFQFTGLVGLSVALNTGHQAPAEDGAQAHGAADRFVAAVVSPAAQDISDIT